MRSFRKVTGRGIGVQRSTLYKAVITVEHEGESNPRILHQVCTGLALVGRINKIMKRQDIAGLNCATSWKFKAVEDIV